MPLLPRPLTRLLKRPLRQGPLHRWLWAAVHGKPYRHPLRKLLPEADQYPANTYRTLSREHLRFTLDISYLTEWRKYYGFADPGIEAFIALLQTGWTVLDIGANIGLVSLEMAVRVGPSGRVVGFEPFPRNAERYAQHVQHNHLDQVQLVQAAVGSSPGTLHLVHTEAHNHATVHAATAADANTVAVPVVTLDGWLAQNPQPRIHALKLDVEGFEPEALRGAQATLQTHRPLLCVELVDAHLRRQSFTPHDVVQPLLGLGYRLTVAATGAPLPANLDGCAIDVIGHPPAQP